MLYLKRRESLVQDVTHVHNLGDRTYLIECGHIEPKAWACPRITAQLTRCQHQRCLKHERSQSISHGRRQRWWFNNQAENSMAMPFCRPVEELAAWAPTRIFSAHAQACMSTNTQHVHGSAKGKAAWDISNILPTNEAMHRVRQAYSCIQYLNNQ